MTGSADTAIASVLDVAGEVLGTVLFIGCDVVVAVVSAVTGNVGALCLPAHSGNAIAATKTTSDNNAEHVRFPRRMLPHLLVVSLCAAAGIYAFAPGNPRFVGE